MLVIKHELLLVLLISNNNYLVLNAGDQSQPITSVHMLS